MPEKAVEFLEAAKPDRPFCLIMALKEPRGPLTHFDPEFPDPGVLCRLNRGNNEFFPFPSRRTVANC